MLTDVMLKFAFPGRRLLFAISAYALRPILYAHPVSPAHWLVVNQSHVVRSHTGTSVNHRGDPQCRLSNFKLLLRLTLF